MRTVYLTAPSAWASYLINCDDSRLSEKEVQDIHQWLMENQLDYPISCGDAGFIKNHDASNYAEAADCQRYLFLEFDGEQPVIGNGNSLELLPLEYVLDDNIPW